MRKVSGKQEMAGAELNLKKLYPVSGLTDFRRTFWLLASTVAVCLIAAAAALIPQSILPDQGMNLMISNGLRGVALVVGACWFAKFMYECLRRHCLYYGVHDGHLLITQGILLKQRGFFPLSRITDIYLERSALDLLFGLHTLHISTPTSLSERFARIEGLNLGTALELQQVLSSMLEHVEERGVAQRSDFGDMDNYVPPVRSMAAAVTF